MRLRGQTKYIVVHCSATKPDMDIGAKEIREWHVAQGWEDIGYHFVVRRSGKLELGRPVNMVGAHVKGYNESSVGICLVGGYRTDGTVAERFDQAFTFFQDRTLRLLLKVLGSFYPYAALRGHRDFSPDRNHDGVITKDEWMKVCPCFDVQSWSAYVGDEDSGSAPE